MKPSVKRDTYAAIGKALRSDDDLGFKRRRSGYWTIDSFPLRWELEVIFEDQYGEGVFRVAWGVRAEGVAPLLEQDEIASAYHTTVGGDLGCLARDKGSMLMMCVEGGTPSTLARFLWHVRAETSDQIAERVTRWTRGPLAKLIDSTRTYLQLASLLEAYPRSHGDRLASPVGGGQTLSTVAALCALGGDADRSRAAMDRWRSSTLRLSGLSRKVLTERQDRIGTRLEALYVHQSRPD